MAEIYVAGPLFNEMEKEHNAIITDNLEKRGHRVFNPIRDGVESAAEYGSMDDDDLVRNIYEIDKDSIDDCTILIANLDGVQVDDGTAFEIGYAVARGKILIGHLTDTRLGLPPGPRNAMLIQPFRYPPNRVFSTKLGVVFYADKLMQQMVLQET